VIYDPMRQEVFTAARGEGAHLENHRIRVSKQRGLEGALLATGFPYREDDRYADNYFAMFRMLTEMTAGIRRPGSAALDLAYVACGRVDGFWEMGLKPWDTAAGTLMIREAGGRVGTLGGDEYQLGANIVAGAPKVYEALIEAQSPRMYRRNCATCRVRQHRRYPREPSMDAPVAKKGLFATKPIATIRRKPPANTWYAPWESRP
jgi:myo-inositol-1(or 4)-monophosphatase